MMFLSVKMRRGVQGEEVSLTPEQEAWILGSFMKVCVRVNSYEELARVHQDAIIAGIESHVVADAGKTEFGGNTTFTACAIGPDRAEKIDAITGNLKLY